MLLLCSTLGDESSRPLSYAQFRTLAERARALGPGGADLRRDLTAKDLTRLGYAPEEAERIEDLLSREAALHADLSAAVRPGTNNMRILVRKWCCGSYLEDQDFFRYNGIFRDVYLLERPQGHLTDIKITADSTGRLKVWTDRSTQVRLFDGEELLQEHQADGYSSEHFFWYAGSEVCP